MRTWLEHDVAHGRMTLADAEKEEARLDAEEKAKAEATKKAVKTAKKEA